MIVRSKITEQKVCGAEEEDREDGAEDCAAKGAIRPWSSASHLWEISPTDFKHQANCECPRDIPALLRCSVHVFCKTDHRW
jgi:hypothetical protein